MAPNLKLHFFPADDINGAVLHEITDEDSYFKGLKLKLERDGLGGAELRLARKVGFAGFGSGTFLPEVFVRILISAYSDTVYYPWGFFLNKRQQTVIHVDEDGGEEFHFGGPGPKQYLDRSALGIEQLTGATFWNLDLENGIWRWGESATVGRILNRIYQEDQARDDPALPDLTLGFDQANDSDGNPWTDDDLGGPDQFELPIGHSLLKSLWDIDDVVELTSWIELGTVAAPIFELNVAEGLRADKTGSAFGAGVCLLREGVNVAEDSLVTEGKSLHKASHVIVEGKDGNWVEVARPSFDPGEYVRIAKITYNRQNSDFWLEKAGLRWLQRQDNGEKEYTVEIVPGADDAAGAYFPRPDRNLWLSNLISLDTSADGMTHTPLDIQPSEDQLVTGLELDTHTASDDTDATAKARSWTVKVKLNIERPGNVAKTPDQRSAARTGETARPLKLCTAIACEDLQAGDLDAETATNGDAENASGTQWSGGTGYSTTYKKAGARSYGRVGATSIDVTYSWGAQVFEAGKRYVLDIWRYQTQDHDDTDLTFGVDGVDEATKHYQGLPGSDPPDLFEEYVTGVDGNTWNRARICWTPSAERTGVRLRFQAVAFVSSDFHVDDLTLYSTDADDLAGDGPGAAACDHGHRLAQLADVDLAGLADADVLTWDGASSRWIPSTGGGGGAPTTADYLVGTAQAGLSAEIVVGTTPGGELGGTWAAPTVDATHSGSAHHAESHASRHASGGADAVKLDDLAAPDDNTDLNSTTSQHGLLPKLGGGTVNYLRADGTWAAPTGSGGVGSLWSMSKSADQTLTNNTPTQITFDIAYIDSGSSVIDLANERFVLPATGLYLIIAHWAWLSTAPGTQWIMDARVNGNSVLPLHRGVANSTVANGAPDTVIPFSGVAGDLLTLFINPGAVTGVVARGAAAGVSDQTRTYFSLVRLA